MSHLSHSMDMVNIQSSASLLSDMYNIDFGYQTTIVYQIKSKYHILLRIHFQE